MKHLCPVSQHDKPAQLLVLFCYQPVNPKPVLNKTRATPPVPPKPTFIPPAKGSPKLTPKGPKPKTLPPKPALPQKQGVEDILKQARTPSANLSSSNVMKTPEKPVNKTNIPIQEQCSQTIFSLSDSKKKACYFDRQIVINAVVMVQKL